MRYIGVYCTYNTITFTSDTRLYKLSRLPGGDLLDSYQAQFLAPSCMGSLLTYRGKYQPTMIPTPPSAFGRGVVMYAFSWIRLADVVYVLYNTYTYMYIQAQKSQGSVSLLVFFGRDGE